YANGRKTMNEFYLPKGKPAKLIMTSEDVIHSFSLPYSRVKQDVQPGMYTYISFEPTLVGDQPVYCTMYCGTGHSDMLATLHVVEPEDYQRWLDTGKAPAGIVAAAAKTAPGGGPLSMADKGKALSASKGCIACHSADGSPKVGPTWKGVFGKDEELQDGTKVKVDENYIRESIVNPTAKIVKGFAPSMPPFAGLLNDDEINALIAYIKSLK
ncbi:MAG: c-type cytochrome, partial [Deltaproteobacteria bacterium]|nr:c-type cytochrome [Deltaproteobacteria bacterium]